MHIHSFLCAITLLAAGCGSHAAAKRGAELSEDSIAKLAEEMKDPEIRSKRERQTPLHIAAEDGNTNNVKRLIREGAVVDASDRWKRTPLHLATEWGHVGVVKDLLASGANVNAVTKLGETPLFFALRY